MRIWKIGGAIVVAVVVVGGGIAFATRDDSESADKDLIITAEVQRRTLRDEVTLTGRLARKEERQITSTAPALVSSVDVEDGAVVEAGQPLLALDGRSAIAVMGDSPFFRPLDVGDKGEDVRQLKQVLSDAGYSPGPIDDRYTEVTRFALAQWQAEHGYPSAKPITAQTVTVSLTQSLGYKIGPRNSTGFVIAGAAAPATGARPGSARAVPARATRITGNPGDPDLTIRSLNATTAEGTPASFVIESSLAVGTATDVTVQLSGSAGADDVVVPSTVTLPANATSVTLAVPTRQDALVEVDEAMTLTLVTGATYNVGAAAQASTTIVSDDLPEVRIDGGATISEGQSATVTLTADQAPTRDVTVALTVSGDATTGRDYRAVDPTVVLAAGATSTTLTVAALTDDVIEKDERVVLALAPVPTSFRAGPAASAVVTIRGDTGTAGRPVVTIRTGNAHLAEGMPLAVSLGLSQALSDELEVSLSYGGTATEGGDFTRPGGRLVIPAGQTTLAVQIPVVDDAVVEVDHTLVVSVASGSAYQVGSPGSVTTTIESDDLPELSIIGASPALDGGATTSFLIQADQAPVKDTSVNYQVVGTAKPGEDFAPLTGNTVLLAGQREVRVTLRTLAKDVVFQPNDMIAGQWPIRVGQVFVDEGESVPAGAPLLSLTAASFTVTLKATASDRTKLAVGQNVTVKLSGGDEEAPGLISELDENATVNEETQEQTYEGLVDVGDLGAADGASVTIDVVLDERVNVFTVPIAAVLQNGSGADVVRVIDLEGGGKVTEKEVETGLTEGSYIEIRSGLDGDEVVIVQIERPA